MRVKHILFILLGLVFLGCSVQPHPIAYGTDACHYCKMTIVDNQHAAQIVTKKGKAFKFDAIECMVNHLKEIDQEKVALFLTSNYITPGELINAQEAVYLISEQIPSPMGAFLSAFKTPDQVNSIEVQGEQYTWQELIHHLK